MSTDTEKDWLQIGVKVNTPHGIQTVTRITEDDGVHVTCGIYCRTELSQAQELFVPVVGEECEIECDGFWGRIGIVAVTQQHVIFCESGKDNEQIVVKSARKFRPINAEREKIIERASAGLSGGLNLEADDVIGQLFDAGMLVLPESKIMKVDMKDVQEDFKRYQGEIDALEEINKVLVSALECVTNSDISHSSTLIAAYSALEKARGYKC